MLAEGRRLPLASLVVTRLRPVRLDDVDAYVAMRCDPAITEHLGGPRRAGDMPDKVARDVADVESGRAVIDMIVVDEDVAGTVSLFRRDDTSEIGWMVLPHFQGRGLATFAVQSVLRRARADDRWDVVHAYPSVDNAASNALCCSTGFTLAGPIDFAYAGRTFRSNDWWLDTSATRS